MESGTGSGVPHDSARRPQGAHGRAAGERRAAQRRARRATDDAFHRTIVDNLADGVYYVDRERRITYWNRGAEQLTGYSAAEVVGRHCHDDLLKHVDAAGRQLCFDGCPLAATMVDGQRRECQVWLRHHDGSRQGVRVRTAPIVEDDEIVGAVEIFDSAAGIIAAQDAASAARRDALTDDLTGLSNRRMLNFVLGARLDDLARYGTPCGLLVGDLDHFKDVNDEYGHIVGDEILRVVATTLEGGVRKGDLVTRWGGEEFAVVANHATTVGLREMAERLRVLVSAIEVPLASGSKIRPTISLGGAIANRGDTLAELFGRADAAVYQAKAAGRNTIVIA